MTARTRMTAMLVTGVAGLMTVGAQASPAATGSPQWTVTAVSRPTNFSPAGPVGEDSYRVTVTNTGGAASDGSPVTIADTLPTGLSLDPSGAFGEDRLTKTKLNCAFLACTYTGAVVPDDTITVTFPVDVAEGAPPTVSNVVTAFGGGAPDASMATLTAISTEPAGMGLSSGGVTTALSSVQAGAHADLTTSIVFNTVNATGSLAGAPKDTTDDLPPGFAGDLVDTPSCPLALFAHSQCPVDTQVGITTLSLLIQGRGQGLVETEPVYNLAPDPGAVAKLGFFAGGSFGVQGDVTVRPGDYGLRTTFQNTYEVQAELQQVSLTIWGVPADPIHDALRWDRATSQFGVADQAKAAPFLTNPTSCGEPLEATFTTDFWEAPEETFSAQMPMGQIVGCDRVLIRPALTAEATTSSASSASGLALGMTIPQTYENAYALATSTLTKAVVTLPEGMTVNPSAGEGLGACTEEQYAQEGSQYAAGQGCPNDSKLGEVRIVSPAIKEPISGSVFLAQPYANPLRTAAHPTGSLLALYIVARLPERGIIIKVAGEVVADPVTGRLVTTFSNLPPLPFTTFSFRFHSGATAPLVTPPACGDYTAQAELTPWAVPAEVLAPAIPPFPITSGVNGGACPSGGVPPFSPQVSAGTLDNGAGSYSPMNIRITRNDGEQEITKFTTVLSPGLTANLTGIPFCSDAQIQAAREVTGQQEIESPSCPAASEIGHTLVGAGVGAVLAWTPGKVYLAGPYHGSALSIVSVTSATVGPFDLGTVVIRFALRINPTTAQAEIDSSGSDPIPHIIDGIVVHVRDIRAYIDRSKFMLNPTNCERMSIQNTVTGAGADPANPADQQSVGLSTPFQAANCANLAFKPMFKASTSAKTSRALGASLDVNVTYPNASLGTQANIHSVKVDLPKQLPSRLTTLQKACPHSVFEANPAGCPAESIVGHAVVHTQILPVPLTGPAYFVSNGGEEFPNLIVVLQGYGVRIDLVGSTFIKHGVTSSTFRSAPDTPFESFELTLPEGKYSALAANGNLCAAGNTVTVSKRVKRRVHGRLQTVTVKVKQKGPGLVMPTALTAQNGTVIKQNTPIAVTGCPKAVVHKARKAAGHMGKGT